MPHECVGMEVRLDRCHGEVRAQGCFTTGERRRLLGLHAPSVCSLGRQAQTLREEINTGRRLTAMYKLTRGYDRGTLGVASASLASRRCATVWKGRIMTALARLEPRIVLRGRITFHRS